MARFSIIAPMGAGNPFLPIEFVAKPPESGKCASAGLQDEPAFRLIFPHVLAGLVTICGGPLNSIGMSDFTRSVSANDL